MPPSTANTHNWIAPIAGWRGVAVVAVVAFHATILDGGWLGVDLFFVLSGYLITMRLASEYQRQGRVSMLGFWRRRFRRLGPALVVFLLGTAVLVALWPTPQSLPSNLTQQFLGTIFYVANWTTLFSPVGYWDSYSVESPLRHMWSLSIEEQFYIFFPPVFLGLVVLGRRYLVAGLAAMTVASWTWALALLAGGTSFERVYLGTDTRLGAVTLGALAGWLIAQPQPKRWLQAASYAAPAALVVVVVLGVTLTGSGIWSASRWVLVITFELAVVILLLAATLDGPGSKIMNKLLSHRFIVWLGALSYGLYLWHIPAQMVFRHLLAGFPALIVFLATLATGTGLAWLSLRYVETPLRTRGLAALPRIPMPAMVGVFALLLFLATATIHDTTFEARNSKIRPILQVNVAPSVGQPSLPSVPEIAKELGSLDGEDSVDRHLIEYFLEDSTVSSALNDDDRVLLLGDSMVYDLTPPLLDNQISLGVIASSTSHIGCSVGGISPADPQVGEANLVASCDQWRRDFGSVARQSQADVIVIMRGSYRADIDGLEPCTYDYGHWYRQQLAEEVKTLSNDGAVIAIVNHAYNRHVTSPSLADERIDCINGFISRFAASVPDVVVVDLQSWLCPDGKCRVQDGEVILRYDGLHFSGAGGEIFLNWLFGVLRDSPR